MFLGYARFIQWEYVLICRIALKEQRTLGRVQNGNKRLLTTFNTWLLPRDYDIVYSPTLGNVCAERIAHRLLESEVKGGQ